MTESKPLRKMKKPPIVMEPWEMEANILSLRNQVKRLRDEFDMFVNMQTKSMVNDMLQKTHIPKALPPFTFTRREILDTIVAEINDSEGREYDVAEIIMKICADYFIQCINIEARKK